MTEPLISNPLFHVCAGLLRTWALACFQPPYPRISNVVPRGTWIHERRAASQRRERCGTRWFVMDAFSMGEEKSSRQCCSGQHSPLWVWWRVSLSASVFTSPQVLSRALRNDSGHPGMWRFYLILLISFYVCVELVKALQWSLFVWRQSLQIQIQDDMFRNKEKGLGKTENTTADFLTLYNGPVLLSH